MARHGWRYPKAVARTQLPRELMTQRDGDPVTGQNRSMSLKFAGAELFNFREVVPDCRWVDIKRFEWDAQSSDADLLAASSTILGMAMTTPATQAAKNHPGSRECTDHTD